MPTAVDHVEAALELLTREDIARLTPARRQRLRAALATWECLCMELVQPKEGVLRRLKEGERSE
jgi:hypothetical protein